MIRAGLLMLAASAVLLAALPGQTGARAQTREPSAGEAAFQRCQACHTLGDTDKGGQGPSLKGLLARPVASRAGYDYSPAFKAYAARNPRWTRAALDAFLANPDGAVPDNEMGFAGIRDAAERAALIDYLAAR